MKKIYIIMPMMLLLMAACGSADSEQDAWGNFETVTTVISSQAGGKLIMLDIRQGQLLGKDSVIGLIDTLQYSLELRQLHGGRQSIGARLGDVEANIGVLHAQKANLEREIDRTRRLLENRAATARQLDELQGNLEVLEQQINAARVSRHGIMAELQSMDARIALAEEKLRQCIIINPVEGTVLEKYVEQHELVMPGRPLYTIADLSSMELRAWVSGSQLPQITIGQNVTVYFDRDRSTDQYLPGTISWISSRAEFTPKTIQTKEERVSQVYAVKVRVDNDGRIKIGMPGSFRIGE